MFNNLSEDNNQLARLNYTELLAAILKQVKRINPFTWSSQDDTTRLGLSIHNIAESISQKNISGLLINNRGVRSATINLTPETQETVIKQIQELYQILSSHLEASRPSEDIKEALFSLVSNLSDFHDPTNNSQPKLGFKHNFQSSPSLMQKRLDLESRSKGSDAVLKLHLLTISVRNIAIFEQQLKTSIENHILSDTDLSPEDQQDIQDNLEELIKNKQSAFYDLTERVYTETVGKLKKEAKILYLEYLQENIDPQKPDLIYLTDLIRRLRLLDQYLNDPNEPDGKYDVSYENVHLNYREYCARAENLDILPIIPIVEGNLGETTAIEQGKKEFIFCLKMKLDGQVKNQGINSDNAFNYYLELLNPESEEHKKRLHDDYRSKRFKEKVLQIFLVYFFVFASRNDPKSANYNYQAELDYDPTAKFDSHFLPILKGNDEAAKKRLFQTMIDGFTMVNTVTKIGRLQQLLKNHLKQTTIIPTKNWSIHLGLEKSLLKSPEAILNERIFFKPVFDNSKEYLRYITIYSSQVEENNLCHLPVNLTIEDIRYFPTNESQSLSLNYHLKDIKTIPIVLWNYVNENDEIYKVYNSNFKSEKLISIAYKKETLIKNEADKVFLYKFTFSLLTYISLKLIIDHVEERLFLPIMRLQRSGQDNTTADEDFMRSFSKILAHLLSHDALSSSQGFDISKPPKQRQYSIPNTLNSLYSVIPRVFEYKNYQPELKKLAIIIISSRESDRTYDEKKIVSNLMGEIVTIDREENKVYLRNAKTFSANYDKDRMYKEPDVVIDQVTELYNKGYRHIFYVAKSPYTSSLVLETKDEDDFLYV